MPTPYSASVMATAQRPYILTHKLTGERYAVSAVMLELYQRKLGSRLTKLYSVDSSYAQRQS